MIKINELPVSIKYMVQHHNAWIVGSAANPKENILKVKDIDVIIPFSEWHKVTGLIPKNARKNDYGGWKYVEEGQTVDVWPDDLNHFMNSAVPEYLWQPRYKIRYKKV